MSQSPKNNYQGSPSPPIEESDHASPEHENDINGKQQSKIQLN